ncbi:RnfABCDGE type electron transport complex subunit D [Herbivorax sp. ANBcel31]|uniref:RnfABCDGE type electron transport complex subunit D n=1 Tax=Herbivorax sp. ANBcel31 TaxID=3069754 RepID=UPI0027B216B3|nr:RnfABCDGE type electron transport complex subunit D [Herbivorax sp. ANBcel31]MDQ2086560.1 RnfABCDGE type electron transport complex subunit D [Herbivorax sp. ANBcel31]
MENKFVVSSSPHIRDSANSRRIMIDVIIALSPAAIAGVYFFGTSALAVILVTILSCVLAEHITRLVMKRESTIADFSAVVTGLLLALNLPPTIPIWIAAVGGVVAIVIVKQMFGGLGQNFMNPALAARVILVVSYTEQMTNWVNPRGVDVVSTATPLEIANQGAPIAEMPSYAQLFLGQVGGCIGETSVLALLLGVVYLLIRKVIGLQIPLTFIGTTALFTWIFAGSTAFTGDFVYHVLAGGLILGAFYMATDYATCPVTNKGRIIMGVGCGILTGIIRLYTNYPEGVSFAIILMNIVVPLIDRYIVPKSFGGGKKVA